LADQVRLHHATRFTQIGASDQWVIHSGLVGGVDETITFVNHASISDFLFS
jgi:hypothetical protein